MLGGEYDEAADWIAHEIEPWATSYALSSLSLCRFRQAAGGRRAGRHRHAHQRERKEREGRRAPWP